MSLPPPSRLTRRDLLSRGSKLSLVSLALLSGLNTKVVAQDERSISSRDIDILNEILGTEHEGIAAYEVCLKGNLFHKTTANTARLFQDHHKTHRDILSENIRTMGGVPVTAKTESDYKDDLNLTVLKSQRQALQVIVKLELGAANGYIGMLPSTSDHELAKMAGRIAADEVMHWTTLSELLGVPLPTQALSFGA